MISNNSGQYMLAGQQYLSSLYIFPEYISFATEKLH